MLAAFTADGTVDYFSLDVGDNWGRVSYIQPGFYDEGQWAPMAGQARTATDRPVVYVGRVTSVETAERILADGHADLVGFARATIADPDLVVKSLEAREPEVRPCIGVQECIDRRVVEGLPFACGVNPHAGREDEGRPPRAAVPRSVLVIGGGPAGTEFAGQMAERGHRVQLWERSGALGGQLAVAAQLRMNANFGQVDPLAGSAASGVSASRCISIARRQPMRSSTPGADVVAVATGAVARRADVPGVDLPFVLSATEAVTDAARVGPSGRGDLRGRPLGAARHRRPPGRRRPRGHASCTRRSPRRRSSASTRSAPSWPASTRRGVTMVPMTRLVADRARRPDAGPLLQRPAVDDGRGRLGRAGLRSRSRSTTCTTRSVRGTRRSTCSATPSPPAAWSSPPARPTSWRTHSTDAHPSV